MLRRAAARNMKRKNEEELEPPASKKPRVEMPQASPPRKFIMPHAYLEYLMMPSYGEFASIDHTLPNIPSTSTNTYAPTHFDLLGQPVSDSLQHGRRTPPVGFFDVRPSRKSSPFPVQRNNGALSREAPPRRTGSSNGIENHHLQSTPTTPAVQFPYPFPISLEYPPSSTQSLDSVGLSFDPISSGGGSWNGDSTQVGLEDAPGSATVLDTIGGVADFDLPYDPDLFPLLDEELGPLPLEYDFSSLEFPWPFGDDFTKGSEGTAQYPVPEPLFPAPQHQKPRSNEDGAPLSSAAFQDFSLEKSSGDAQDADLQTSLEPFLNWSLPSAVTNPEPSSVQQEQKKPEVQHEQKKPEVAPITREKEQSNTAVLTGIEAESIHTQSSSIDFRSLINRNVSLFQTDALPLGRYFGQDFWSSEKEFPTFIRNLGKEMDKSYHNAHSLTTTDPQVTGTATVAFWEKFLLLLRWSRKNRQAFASMMAQGKSYASTMKEHLPNQANDWIRGALLTNLITLNENPENRAQSLSKDDVKVAREAALALVEYEVNERHAAINELWEHRRQNLVPSRPQGQASSPQATPKQSHSAKRRREAEDQPSQVSSAPDDGRPQKRVKRPSPLSQELVPVEPNLPPKQGTVHFQKPLSPTKSAQGSSLNGLRKETEVHQSRDGLLITTLGVSSSRAEETTAQSPVTGSNDGIFTTPTETATYAPLIDDRAPIAQAGATTVDGWPFNAWGSGDMGLGELSSEELKKLIDDFF